jgi:hypothetical protein
MVHVNEREAVVGVELMHAANNVSARPLCPADSDQKTILSLRNDSSAYRLSVSPAN